MASTSQPKAAAATYKITGIRDGIVDGRVPLRLEADEWYPGKTEEHIFQNSLFLHALYILENKSPEEKISFFQLAGIHGLPYQPWDENTAAQTVGKGYCTHDSLLFPCWHRPQMLLFEQALYEIMLNEVIPQLPTTEQKKWICAAATFRLPYWDWAQKKERDGKRIFDIPMIAKGAQIEVVDLKIPAKTVKIPNPMYKFTIPTGQNSGSYGVSNIQSDPADGPIKTVPYSKSVGTSRWAPYEQDSAKVSVEWQDGTVNNDRIAEALQNHKWLEHDDDISLSEMVYRLFDHKYVNTYTQFATTRHAEGTQPASYVSLEFIHNNIHVWAGGMDQYIGHMADVPVAAFDPIFFLHHANVDRLFALWQAVNKNNEHNWFQNRDEQLPDDGNWSIKPNTVVTPQTPLAPFHKDENGTHFVSDDIRNWIDWGYSYPELQPWLKKYNPGGKFDEDLYIEDVRAKIDGLYKPTGLSGITSDFIVNVEYKRFGLSGVPYTIYFFIGPKKELDGYRGPLHAHPSLVGYVYTFTNPIIADGDTPGCENCRTKAAEGTKSRAQIPITAALLRRVGTATAGGLIGTLTNLTSSLDLGSVEGLLENQLHWKVVVYGEEVQIPEEEPFIEVSVFGTSLGHGAIPRLGLYRPLLSATRGKPGGLIHF